MAEEPRDQDIRNFVGGWNSTDDDTDIADNQMADGSQNVIASVSKTTLRKGYAKDNSTAIVASQSVTSIFDGVNDIMVTTSDGQIWERSGAGSYTSRGTGFANSAINWVSYNSLDIFCDGTNTPRKWNGTTLATLGGSPPSGDFAVIFREHMFIFDRDTGEARFSEQGDIETWPTTNSIQVDKNTREKNRAAISTRDRIVIWKQRSIHHIAGFDKLDFERIPISEGIGCVSHAAAIHLTGSPNPQWNGLYWVDQEGYYFSPDLGVSCIKISDLPGRSIQASFDALTKASIGNARVGIVQALNQIWFCVPKAGSTNDRVHVWDYRLGIWQPEYVGGNFSAITEISSGGSFVTWVGESVAATGAFVYQVNNGFSDAGTAISGVIRTKRFDFGLPLDQLKTLEKAISNHDVAAAHNLTLKVFYDFSTSADETKTIAMTTNRGNARFNKAVRQAQFSLEFSSSTLTPAIRRFYLRVRPGGPGSEP